MRSLAAIATLWIYSGSARADFAITKVSNSLNGVVRIEFESESGDYYLLNERANAESDGVYRAIVIGEGESSRFEIVPDEGQVRLYTIVRIPKNQPLSDIDSQAAQWIRELADEGPVVDLDGDGLDDNWEISNGFDPSRKDNPALELIVYTPLTK